MDSMNAELGSHQVLIEQLPDYAVGALDDAQQDAIARHLESCRACQEELRHILRTISIMNDDMAPLPATRTRLLARVRAEQSPSHDITLLESPPTTLPVPAPLPPVALATANQRRTRHWWQQPASIASLLLATALAIALGFTLNRQERSVEGGELTSIVASAPFALLTDSALSPPASGILFAADDATRAVLRAEGLPSLPPDETYQIWLFREDGQRVRGGSFSVDQTGRAAIIIDLPQPRGAFAAIAISAEPVAGHDVPTAPLALGGWLQ